MHGAERLNDAERLRRARSNGPSDRENHHRSKGSATEDGRHARSATSTSAMASKQNVLGLIHASRQIRRPPLGGMQFLHEQAVRAADLDHACTWRNAKDLI